MSDPYSAKNLINSVPRIPNFSLPAFRTPVVKIDQGNPAKWMFERLSKQIVAFEAALSTEEEIGGRFVTAPKEGPMHIADIAYWGPDMLIFYGTDSEGRPIELLQHYTQMSILLCAVKKERDEARRIGFILEERLKKQSSES